jgi:hypothetical protein
LISEEILLIRDPGMRFEDLKLGLLKRKIDYGSDEKCDNRTILRNGYMSRDF